MSYKYDDSGKVICKPPSSRKPARWRGSSEWRDRMKEEAEAARKLGWWGAPKPAKPMPHLEAVLQHAEAMAAGMGPYTKRQGPSEPTIIYIVTSEGAPGIVKIGITSNLPKRLRGMTTATGRRCAAVAAWRAEGCIVREIEARVKYALARRRTHGEWFRAPIAPFVRYVGMMMNDAGTRVV